MQLFLWYKIKNVCSFFFDFSQKRGIPHTKSGCFSQKPNLTISQVRLFQKYRILISKYSTLLKLQSVLLKRKDDFQNREDEL